MAEEVKITGLYMDIMNFRYMNGITYRCRLPQEIENLYLPKFMLQPILENSIQHGLANIHREKVISVDFQFNEKEFWIQVVDNGIGIPQSKLKNILEPDLHVETESSIGLNNVHRRIQLIYGSDYGLTVTSKEGYYTKVVYHFPAVKGNVSP